MYAGFARQPFYLWQATRPGNVFKINREKKRARHVSAAVKTSCCFIDTTQVLLPAGSNHCTSLMVGLIQQGYGLEVCSFTRYASCKDSAPKVCPTSRQSQRPLEVDMQKGIRIPYKVYNKVQNIPVQRKDGKGSCIGTKFLYYLPKGKSTQPDFVGDSFSLRYNLKISSLSILTENEKAKRKLARVLEKLQSILHKNRLKNKVEEFFNLSIEVKCLIFCYEIHRAKISHRKFNETMAPGTVQWMAMFKIKLCVACPSGFSLLSIREDEQSLSLLCSCHCNLLMPFYSVELSKDTYLLRFSHMGLHMNSQQKSCVQKLKCTTMMLRLWNEFKSLG
ncbi:hypothetical protein GH733_019071 [Mirounga leonina]|nr:hypothetical protein GH733_019071 [Mirounga leonina]